MGSQVQDLPYLKTNPKYIFFTDFDGTITLQDSKSNAYTYAEPVLQKIQENTSSTKSQHIP
jgi:2-hydroxy-3-keto-5-methylthiopentenyl-1-phosphate phosphatase